MKNIQFVDGAVNCVYDIVAVADEEFACIFKPGQDIAFVEDVLESGDATALERAFGAVWQRRVPKAMVAGIHETLFCELSEKKAYYPTLKDEDAVNPDGSRLRQGR